MASKKGNAGRNATGNANEQIEATRIPYLRQRRHRWFLQVPIPKAIRDHPQYKGKTRLEISTGTDSRLAAIKFRDRELPKLRKTFETYLKESEPTQIDIAMVRHKEMARFHAKLRGMPWADETEKQQALSEETEIDDGSLAQLLLKNDINPTPDALAAFRVARVQGLKGALNIDMTGGDLPPNRFATPLTRHKQAWLDARGRKGREKSPRTKQEWSYALEKLAKWLEANNKPQTVEFVTPVIVQTFVRHLAEERHEKTHKRRSAQTVNKLVMGLLNYWNFQMRRLRIITINPWQHQFLPVADRRQEEVRRSFTDAELPLLFQRAPQQLKEVCALGLLLGGRREDLFRITPSDLRGDAVMLQGAKTGKSYWVPIHSLIQPLVKRLAKGKGTREPLLSVPPSKGESKRPVADALGKRFTRFKSELFHGEKTLTFHSLRHTLGRLMESAGAPEHIGARMLGHTGELGITYSRYSAADIDLIRGYLEKLNLPKEVVEEIKALASTSNP